MKNKILLFLETSMYTADSVSSSVAREKQMEHIEHYVMKRSTMHKRDVSLALLAGIIGMTSEAVHSLKSYTPPKSNGGCEWLGTSPFCYDSCPSDYDMIREHSGRCGESDIVDDTTDSCIPDPSFGEPCLSLFGREFTKKFCCKYVLFGFILKSYN